MSKLSISRVEPQPQLQSGNPLMASNDRIQGITIAARDFRFQNVAGSLSGGNVGLNRMLREPACATRISEADRRRSGATSPEQAVAALRPQGYSLVN